MSTRIAAVLFVVSIVLSGCASESAAQTAGEADRVPDPSLINVPNTHWINREVQCTTPDVEATPSHDVVFQPSSTPQPDPAACPTPQPTPGVAAVAAAQPLRIARLSVPLTQRGPVTQAIGQVVLPNGYYTGTSFDILNAGDGTYQVYNVHVELVPAAAGRPPMAGSVATRPLTDGPETFNAYLVFDVRSFQPGTALVVGNLLVH